MMLNMLTTASKQHKIFNSIIGLDTVNMVDKLGRQKMTTQLFFHYKTMLINKLSFFKVGTILKANISSRINCFATFPSAISFSGILRKFLSFIPRNPFLSINMRAILRAENTAAFFDLRWNCIKFLITNPTKSFYLFSPTYSTAYIGAKLPSSLNMAFGSIKFFPANLTRYIKTFKHIFSIIKRAVFGGSSRTVKFLHLLTARISDIINPPLMNIYSIA